MASTSNKTFDPTAYLESEDSDSELVLNTSTRYVDNAEWEDIKPIYNTPAEDAVVRINHSAQFVDAFAYFRAILHKNEVSERAFELTTTCTQLNPANYSVWQYRRNLLRGLNKDKDAEFRFCEEMACENPKNYQVWHHRRVLVEWNDDPSREMQFTEEILASDNKNYHAWQHRQWVVEKYSLFDQIEIDYSTKLLAEDLRNNSAWNYRHFILKTLSDQFQSKEVMTKEVEFVKKAIVKLSGNESAWSYLTGILVPEGIGAHPEILEFCLALHEDPTQQSPHLRYVLFDFHVHQLEKGIEKSENAEKALKLLEELEVVDKVRHNYFTHLKNRVQNLISDVS